MLSCVALMSRVEELMHDDPGKNYSEQQLQSTGL